MESVHSKLISGALIDEAKQWRDSNNDQKKRIFIACNIDADAIEEQLIINGFKVEQNPFGNGLVKFTLIK